MESYVIRVIVVFLLAIISDGVLTECSAGSTFCSGSTCSSCEYSYYLSGGFCSPCPKDYNSCKDNGECTSCRENKWGLEGRCLYNCNNNCLNRECQDANGYCNQCKTGLYGLQCQHNCNICADGLCDLRGCTQGCKQGYYEYNIGSESFCQKCPQDCKYCTDANTCHVYNDGLHLYQFNSNGKIFILCIICSNRPNCSTYCLIQSCNLCKIQDEALVCTDCPEGQRFNGVACTPHTTSCSQECSSNCDKNGICLGSCNDGWTGERCSEKCSDKCLTCEKSDGEICKQYKGDYYSTNCSSACNPSCIKESGKQTCRLNDGYCLNGCEDTYWGNFYSRPCSEDCADIGIPLTCDRSNGTCTNGCKEGYNGVKCDVTDASKTTGKPNGKAAAAITTTATQICAQCKGEENDSSTNTFIVGFFSGLGTSIIIAAIAVSFYQLRRRYTSRKLNSHRQTNHEAEMPTYYNDDGTGNASTAREPDNETNRFIINSRTTECQLLQHGYQKIISE